MSEKTVHEISFSNIPPIVVKRNTYGLLENVNYIFKEDGLIDWRKMVNPKYLVINTLYKDKIEEVYGKPANELDLTQIDDKYLLILLAGIKELARLRGFERVSYEIPEANELFVAATCNIDWLPNYETENRAVSFQDGGDANNHNTSSFAKSFLTTIAINRAFVRSVRNFLGINLLGKDEIADKLAVSNDEVPDKDENIGSDVHSLLEQRMKEKDIPFEKVRKHCLKTDAEAKNWSTVKDIPKITVFTLLQKINESKKDE